MSSSDSAQGNIVVVGGGHAAAQLCAGLVAAGLGARVHLVCEEVELPYQRPPLSKAYLKSPDEALQAHRSEAWYVDSGITLHRADPAVRIDRGLRRVRLRSGTELTYSSVVLATGTRARRLAHLPDGLSNVAVLRTAADARRLGAGFKNKGERARQRLLQHLIGRRGDAVGVVADVGEVVADKAQVGFLRVQPFDPTQLVHRLGIMNITADTIHGVGRIDNDTTLAQHLHRLQDAVLGRIFGVNTKQGGSHREVKR